MLAFGIDRVGMESSRARSTRSVCVVALWLSESARICRECVAPERISHYKERDIDLVGVFEYVVAGRLDHLAVGYDDFSAIESFLLS